MRIHPSIVAAAMTLALAVPTVAGAAALRPSAGANVSRADAFDRAVARHSQRYVKEAVVSSVYLGTTSGNCTLVLTNALDIADNSEGTGFLWTPNCS